MAIILSFLLSLWIFRRTQQALARCAEVAVGSLFLEGGEVICRMMYKIEIDLGQVFRDLGSSHLVYYEVFI